MRSREGLTSAPEAELYGPLFRRPSNGESRPPAYHAMQEVRIVPLASKQPATPEPHGLLSLEQALAGCDMRHVSLVLLHVEGLTELRIIYGTAACRTAVETIHRALGRVASGRGFGARTGPTDYTIVLPDLYK